MLLRAHACMAQLPQSHRQRLAGQDAPAPAPTVASYRRLSPASSPPLPADSFTAEVASSLSQKLKYNRRDAYACLVATPAVPVNFPQAPLGVVELSVQKDSEVLEACGMPEGGEYAYVAGMAVEEEWRRRGVARAMLAACEVLARKWGLSAVVLHVFSDNAPALATYSAAGFELVSEAGGGFLSGRKRALLCKDL